jgi:hypothetical protein
MIAYQLDSLNFFLNTVKCNIDPKNETRYAIPKGAVTVEPPPIKENECQYWNNISWEIKPDFSGKIYYSKIDKSEKRFLKGESFDSSYTELIPPPETYIIWKNNSWEVDETLKSEFLKNQCKAKAKSLISSSDWSVLIDVNISNKSEFESYRAILRNLILNPVENPIFPIEPDPIWN